MAVGPGWPLVECMLVLEWHAGARDMTVKVRFFASLAETVGRREADVEFDDSLTVAAVWRQVTREQAVPEGLLCAVNQGYCEVDQAVADNDEVAFFPPVTGG